MSLSLFGCVFHVHFGCMIMDRQSVVCSGFTHISNYLDIPKFN